MKLQKRILALALTLAMVLSLVPAGVAAQETALTLGTKVKVVTDREGTIFTFTPAEDGYYTIASYGEENTRVYVLSEAGKYVSHDNDSGSGDNFNDTVWLEKGKTYRYEVSCFEDEAREFEIMLTRCPIAALEAYDIELIHNIDGHWYTRYGEDGPVLGFLYHKLDEKVRYKVTFADGTSQTVTGSVFTYQGQEYAVDVGSALRGSQGLEIFPLGAVEEYEVYISSECYSTAKATLVANDIASVKLDPLQIPKKTAGLEDEDSGYRYGYWEYKVNGTVFLKDGTAIPLERGEFLYNGEGKSIGVVDNQFQNPWKPGNTYEGTVYVGSVSTKIAIEIVDTNVESIHPDEITLVENTNGSLVDGYYHYDWEKQLEGYFYASDQDTGVPIEDGTYTYNGETYTIVGEDTQSKQTPWKAGNTYEVSFAIDGLKATTTVSITKAPIESIILEQDPVVIVENTGGWLEDGVYYYDWAKALRGEVVWSSGEVTEIDEGYVQNPETGYWYEIETIDTQEKTPWKAGNTYTATLSTWGYQQQVQISIVKSPVAEVQWENTTIQIIEGTNGSWEEDEDGNEYYEYYYGDELYGTFYDQDGNEGWINYGEIYYEDQESYVEVSDNQKSAHWTVGNRYKVQMYVLGYPTEIWVEIVENPVASIEIEPVTLYEHLDGYWTEEWWVEGEFFIYDYWDSEIMRAKVTLKDGSVIRCSGRYFDLNGTEYYIDTDCGQYENHWKVGNTYTVKASFGNVEADYKVTVAENPIKSVTVKPIELVQDLDNEQDFGEGYPWYRWWYEAEITVTFKDGTSQTIKGIWSDDEISYQGRVFERDYETGQDEEYWEEPGDYATYITIGGMEVPVTVTITEPVIKSITASNVTITPNTHGEGNWVDEDEKRYYYYNWLSALPELKVNFTDGTSVTVEDGVFTRNGREYYVYQEDTQHESPWQAGNTYDAAIVLGSYTKPIRVTIEESPIKSITVEPEILTGNVGWFGAPAYCSITFKDGTKISGYLPELYYQGEQLDVYANFEDGATTGTATILGKEVTVESYLYEEIQSGDYLYVLHNGKAYITGYYGDETDLKLPSTIDGYSVVGLLSLFGAWGNIETLNIPNNITYVGYRAFFPGYNENFEILPYTLKKLTVGTGVKDLTPGLMAYCDVQEISINSSNSYMTVYKGVVYDKNKTKVLFYPWSLSDTITFPSTVKDIERVVQRAGTHENLSIKLGSGIKDYTMSGGALYNKDKTILYFVNRNQTGTFTLPSTVTEIKDGAFFGSSLSEVNLSGKLQELPYQLFAGSKNLTKVTLPQNLKEIPAYTFTECTALTSVALGDKLETIGEGAFYKSGLKSVTVPDSVKEIEAGAFCQTPLTSVKLGTGLERIGDSAFAETKLTSVALPDSLRELDYDVFRDSEKLATIQLGDGLEYMGRDVFTGTAWEKAQPDGPLYMEDILVGFKGDMPENYKFVIKEGTRLVAENALSYYPNMVELVIPASVVSMGVFNLHDAWNLTKVTVDPANENIRFDGRVLYDRNSELWGVLETLEAEVYEDTVPFGTRLENIDVEFLAIRADGRDWWLYTEELSSITGYDPYKAGAQTVTATLGKVSTTFTITVEDPELEDFAITKLPSTTEYAKGESLKLGDMVVTGWTVDGLMFPVRDYTVSGYDANKLGTQTVTISYYGKTDTFTVTVDEDLVIYVEEGIQVKTDDGVIAQNATLVVEQLEVTTTMPQKFWENKSLVYDISFQKNGQDVQPNGKVTVYLPVPEGMDGYGCKVYHMDENGNLTDMRAKCIGEFMVFETDHFSYYALVEEGGLPGDIDGNEEKNTEDAVYLLLYVLFGENQYPVASGTQLDINGDGKVDTEDAVYLLLNVLFGDAQYPI